VSLLPVGQGTHPYDRPKVCGRIGGNLRNRLRGPAISWMCRPESSFAKSEAFAGSAPSAVSSPPTPPYAGCRGTIPTPGDKMDGTPGPPAAEPRLRSLPETREARCACGRPNAWRVNRASRNRSPLDLATFGAAVAPRLPARSGKGRHYYAFRSAAENRAIPEFFCGYPQPAYRRLR